MSISVSLTGDWLSNLGNRRAVSGTVTGDASYPTGGYALAAGAIGLGKIERIEFNSDGGYTLAYNYGTGKVQVYVDGGNLPSVVVTGGQGAGPALQITPDSNAGVLGKTAAGTRTIPGSTFGLTASAAAQIEVPNTTSLTGLTSEFWATGW